MVTITAFAFIVTVYAIMTLIRGAVSYGPYADAETVSDPPPIVEP
jgi:hypothetical protein